MDLGNQSEKYKLAKCIRLNFKQNSHLLILSLGCILYFSQCNTSKHLNDGQYLLTKNIIVENGKKIRKHQVHELVKQKTNKKTWGFLPLYLQIYNLASNKKKNHYLKRIGEAPVIFNSILAEKSISQIKIHYKNKGYFDAKVVLNKEIKKNKIKSEYTIETGEYYKVNIFELDKKNNLPIASRILETIENTTIKPGQFYNLSQLEIERERISVLLQNEGYYKFNKEYLYFIADTNQQKKVVDLYLAVKPPPRIDTSIDNSKNHKKGRIQNIFVHLENLSSNASQDTTFHQGIYFISNNSGINYNRLVEKIFISSGQLFNKKIVDKSYQALSELSHFKKIFFEFISIDSLKEEEKLEGHLYLTAGKKLAYSLEAELSTNPELNEGISGAAAINHYDLFKGGENLGLKFVKSKTLNNVNENGFVLNLSLPSLVSPLDLSSFRNKNTQTKTTFSISYKKQERLEFTRNTLKSGYTYQWKRRKKFQHNLSLVNLSYVNFEQGSLSLSTISEYLISKDYSDHLIPSSSYTLTFNNQNINKLKNHSFFRFHIETSGNLLNTFVRPLNLDRLVDEQGNEILQNNGEPIFTVNLLNNQTIFSQYIKTSFDYRYYFEISSEQSIAIRSMAGLIYAYGNTNQAPFHKKFIAGGSNDLRGWAAFKRPTGGLEYSDSLYTGGVKLLSSFEFRFKLVKKLNAALFIDAGNIWELKQNNNNFEEANFKWNSFLNQIAVDVGFGFRYDFKYFLIRTDFGFPLRETSVKENWRWNQLNFKNSQFNIGLGYPF
jgi:outer membrane protein assembly factor BamA